MRWPGIVVALATAACFSPAPPEGAACTADGQCPEGLGCYGGVCLAAPADSTIDVTVDTPAACADHRGLGTFGAPKLVMELSTLDGEGTPSFSTDRLEIFFKSDRLGTEGRYDLWRASRDASADVWDAAVNLGTINTTADEVGAEISADGLTLYFSSDRTGTSGGLDFFMARRTDLVSPFGAPTRIAELSSPELDEGIFISPDERVAYFHSKRLDPDAEARLFRATRASAQAAWSTPVEVGELTSGTGDENPWVTADDCVIYFQSTRNGGSGLADIWRAERPAPGAPFGTPVNIGTPNNNAYDADPQLSADERYIMFVSNRPGVGYFDLYESSR